MLQPDLRRMSYEVVLDSGETPNKCTVAPLRERPDFTFHAVKGANSLGPLRSQILLHHEGRCLTDFRPGEGRVRSIASVDCVWRRLDSLLRRVKGALPEFVRIPNGFVTAYPRKSAYQHDPEGGLATIEAIFTASALLGNWDLSLFSSYYFGRRFLELNKARFLELGVAAAARGEQEVTLNLRPRNALQRRLDRGHTLRV